MWIEEYRVAHGMDLDDFANAVTKYGREQMLPPLVCSISDTLKYMLERIKDCVTHPVIANTIASYCGATPEQRDMIVAKVHRGKWTPGQAVEYAEPCGVRFNNAPNGAKAVVKINTSGNVVGAFESVAEAARREPYTEDLIRKHCKRLVKYPFTPMRPYTYRYQSEWQAMSREEQLRDI